MKQFHYRFLDRLDFVVLTRAQIAADDLAALVQAERLCATHTIEVWDGARKVARVNKDKFATSAYRMGDQDLPRQGKL